MSWLITGNRNDIILRTSETGKLSFSGGGKQECSPIESGFYPFSKEETAFFIRVREANCEWHIVTEIEPKRTIIEGMDELAHRVKSNPDQSHTLVNFYGDKDVGFTFAVPESTFSNIKWMIEQILKTDTSQYSISMDFAGFAKEGLKIGIPTWEEFVSDKPYLYGGFSLGISQTKR